MRSHSRLAIVLSGLLLLCGPASAQTDYPTRPIRFIIPFPTGGSTDIVARVIADAMAKQLGQSVVADNRPGASGTVGTKAVAEATPDGYTMLMAVAASFTAAPHLFKSLAYDPVKNFRSIGMIGTSVNVLVVSENVQAKTVKDLLELARQRPGDLSFASSGVSSSSFFAAELMKARTGVNILHVPYKGAQAYISDLMAGRVQMTFQVFAGAVQSIATGKVDTRDHRRSLDTDNIRKLFLRERPTTPVRPQIAIKSFLFHRPWRGAQWLSGHVGYAR